MWKNAPKIYPPLKGPDEDDYCRATDELFGHMDRDEVFTDEQRRMINRRAREFFMRRQSVH